MCSKNRILWIDVAKGICMISVIAGHMGVSAINNVVFSYHLTVFFILSGYTLKNNLSTETLSAKFRRLMVPYFITCVAVTAMDVFNRILLKGTADFVTITQVVGYDLLRGFMASGTIKKFGTIEIGGRIGAIWYLPATFFAVMIAQVLLKYVEQAKKRYAVAIPLALLSCISAQFIWLPFSIQSAFLAAPLVLLGYDLKQNGKLDQLSLKTVSVCLVIFVIGVLAKKTLVYYVTARMPDYVLSIMFALASSVCVIYFAQKLAGCKPLAWIGRNSIYYLCIHLFEMETMGTWFSMLLAALGVPVNAMTYFTVKLLFITVVTMLILLGKKLWSSKKTEKITLQAVRDPALDVAKAVLIVLMILGPFRVDKQFRSIVYSFHIMSFVFYSGYCFRPETCKNLPKTIWKEIKRFLVPYALFGIGYILLTHDGIWVEIKRLIYGISFTKNLFVDVASIGPVCFILLLFVTKVIYLFIERYAPDERWKALSVLGVSVLGMYLGEKGYWLPWSADCAMYALIFYFLGHCLKKYGIMEYICKRNYYYFVLSGVWAYMIYKGSMEIGIRNYGMYGLSVLGAVSAAVLLYMVCKYICQMWNRNIVGLICWVGKNTMYILITHKLLAGYIAKAVSLVFTNGSVFYVAAMVLMQLIVGVMMGNLVTWIQKHLFNTEVHKV